MDPPTFSLSCWCGPTITPWHEEAVVEVTCSGLDTSPGCGHFLLAVMVLSLSSQPHGFRKGAVSTEAAAGSGKAKFVLHEILHSLWSWPCLTGQCHAFARAAPAQLGRSAGTWRVVELCPRDLENCKQKSLYAPLGVAARWAWVMPETGTTEDTNLSQTCVLFSVQPIYTLHSCYFFPGYMNVSCPRCFPSSLSKPCCFLCVFAGRLTEPSLLGRDHTSQRRHLSLVCSFQEPGPALPLSPTRISLDRNCTHSLGCVSTEFVLPG